MSIFASNVPCEKAASMEMWTVAGVGRISNFPLVQLFPSLHQIGKTKNICWMMEYDINLGENNIVQIVRLLGLIYAHNGNDRVDSETKMVD